MVPAQSSRPVRTRKPSRKASQNNEVAAKVTKKPANKRNVKATARASSRAASALAEATKTPEAPQAQVSDAQVPEPQVPKHAEDEWIEPPLAPPAPSFMDYPGGVRTSVLQNMQPIGIPPSAKIKAQAKAQPARRYKRKFEEDMPGAVPSAPKPTAAAGKKSKVTKKNQSAAAAEPTRRSKRQKVKGEEEVTKTVSPGPEEVVCTRTGSENIPQTEVLAQGDADEGKEQVPVPPIHIQGPAEESTLAKTKTIATTKVPATALGRLGTLLPQPSIPEDHPLMKRPNLKNVRAAVMKKAKGLGRQSLGYAMERFFEESVTQPEHADLMEALLSRKDDPAQQTAFREHIQDLRRQGRAAERTADQNVRPTADTDSPISPGTTHVPALMSTTEATTSVEPAQSTTVRRASRSSSLSSIATSVEVSLFGRRTEKAPAHLRAPFETTSSSIQASVSVSPAPALLPPPSRRPSATNRSTTATTTQASKRSASAIDLGEKQLDELIMSKRHKARHEFENGLIEESAVRGSLDVEETLPWPQVYSNSVLGPVGEDLPSAAGRGANIRLRLKGPAPPKPKGAEDGHPTPDPSAPSGSGASKAAPPAHSAVAITSTRQATPEELPSKRAKTARVMNS